MAVERKPEKHEEEEKITYEMLAPEGGWGHVVMLATAAVFIFTVVPMSAFGLLYGDFMRKIGDETSGTALTNGMFNTVYSFTGLIANSMLANMSCRKVALIGALIYFIGACGIIFVKTLVQMIICFGVIQGLGFGLMTPAVFTSLNLYFDHKRSLMNSIAQAMMVAGIMVCPILVKIMLDTYGFRGTVALFAALSLNCFAAGATLQPVKWHMKKRRLSVDEARKFITAVSQEALSMAKKSLSRELITMSKSAAVSNEKLNHHHQSSSLCEEVLRSQIAPLIENKTMRDIKLEEGVNKGFFKYVMKPRQSIISMGSRAMSVNTLNKIGQPVMDGVIENEKLSMWHSLIESMQLSLFKDPKYINITLGLSLSITSDVVFISLFPLLLENAGYGKSEVTTLMTIYFGSDLVSRIFLSVVAGFVSFRNRYLFLVGSLISAIFRTAFTMECGYWWKVSVTGILGFFRCFVQTPMPLVIAEEYSDKFASAFSLYMVVNGAISLIFGPLIKMSSDTSMESLLKTMLLNDFWSRIHDEYPLHGKKALSVLLPFPTTYLCEAGFSTYAATKTKYRNRLDAEPDMRLQLSSIKPDIKLLNKNKKLFHTSH